MFAHVTVTKLADKGAARLTSASLGLSRASSFAIFKDHPLQFPILLPILDPLSRFKFLSYTCRLSRCEYGILPASTPGFQKPVVPRR